MKILEITKGKKVYQIKIDDEDVEKVRNHKWIWRDGYACTLINNRYYQMHRLIMGVPMGAKHILVDHINGDHKCNLRSNLRLANRFENQQNRKTNEGNTLPKGIRILPNSKYNVRVQYFGKRAVFGAFDTLEEAVEARNEFAQRAHGQFFRASHLIEPKEEEVLPNDSK